MPSNLSQIGGMGGVPLGELPTDPKGVNESRPRTFAPPTGVNTGTPGRPRTVQGGSGGGGGGAAGGAGTVPAPPAIAQLTSPARFQQGMGATPGAPPQGQMMGAGALGGVLPMLAQGGGQMDFDPFTGNWIMPDGTIKPGVTGGA